MSNCDFWLLDQNYQVFTLSNVPGSKICRYCRCRNSQKETSQKCTEKLPVRYKLEWFIVHRKWVCYANEGVCYKAGDLWGTKNVQIQNKIHLHVINKLICNRILYPLLAIICIFIFFTNMSNCPLLTSKNNRSKYRYCISQKSACALKIV